MGAPSYYILEDFGKGLDVRKSSVTAPAGTLRVLDNGFINPGGEIEKRRKLSKLATVSSVDTTGLAAINNKLFVFGTAASVTVPAPLTYQRLTPTGGVTIDRILDVDVFNSKLFVIARMSDNSVRRFWDGAEVSVGGGIAARTFASKIHLVENSNWRFSAVANPGDFAGTGSGIVDVTTQESGAAELLGIERYYDLLALFGRRSIQLWSVDPDPNKSQLTETLSNTGLAAPQALTRYGNGDVIFLSNSGFRSVRARDASNAASVTDIGSPIDQLILDRRLSLSETEAEKIWALVDPITAQVWFIWGSKIYVLSYFPSARISAWSIFALPFGIDYAVAAGSRVALRAGNDIYIYGGFQSAATALDYYVPAASLPDEYDTTVCAVETPFMDMGKPATEKLFTAFDMACEGSWKVQFNPDPTNPGAWDTIGTFSQTTYSLARIPVSARGTHVAFRLESVGSGFAKVGSLTIHYQAADAS